MNGADGDLYARYVGHLPQFKRAMPGRECVCSNGRGRSFGAWANCPHGWAGQLAELDRQRGRLIAALAAHEAQTATSRGVQ